ncbi:MAG TPA: hypothetical protein VHB50_03655, partial [Bryobacteraceae bacterium]|nr:hypothetical protein [Bryobacteraceae bacterium]
TGVWNIYVLDTTHASNPGCPCIADFPQIGSDQYGFYVSANEYDALYLQPVDSVILAISKTGLGSGAAAPSTLEFSLPLTSGFEFAIQPATTPPGANNFVASGGVEYLVSSQAFYSINSLLALWALSNTASLQGSNPSLLLTQTLVSALSYTYPGVASQKPGPLPYGSSLIPPGQLAFIDGNIDSRIQSVSYAGGRLYVSLPTQVIDDAGTSVVGAGYVILSPTFRSSAVAASVLKKGYVSVTNNHVLRPAISVNSKGQGVIAFTLVGPDYYPSAAFTTFDANTSPSAVRIAGAGAGPEDGFTGYFPSFSAPVARWGDYSTAVTSADGSIWSVSEYIPAGNRTPLANWGTYISRYVP